MNHCGEKTIAITKVRRNINQHVCDFILIINNAVKKKCWNFYSRASQKDKVRSGGGGRGR